jgi:signal transduction histidine kinase
LEATAADRLAVRDPTEPSELERTQRHMRTAGAVTAAASGPPPAGGIANRLLRAPFTRRTWAETLYALVGVVLGAAGFVGVAAALYVGALLAVTLVGLPLIAAALRGARRLGGLHRDLAGRLLGVKVGAPAPLRPTPGSGFLGWVWSGLRDAAGWRAVLYLLVKFPVALVTFAVVAAFWLYGVFFVAYPLLRLVLPRERDRQGTWHRGLQLFSDIYLDTWPRILAVVVVGVVLLAAAPWVVHSVLALERRLVGGLLGPTRLSQRVRDLEETRAHAVDDAAEALRRIERDLHDGAQARLVALAMKLGMAKDELDEDSAADPQAALERTRALVDTAHHSAKQALVELRELARGIHPPVLDSGLDAALATLAARSAVPVALHVNVPERPSPSIETIAYFCAAELLTNVAKHSRARHATVELTQQPAGRLWLRVRDDGVGGARISGGAGGSGLAGLADRVRTVDGRLEITSLPGGPTVVAVELPSHP